MILRLTEPASLALPPAKRRRRVPTKALPFLAARREAAPARTVRTSPRTRAAAVELAGAAGVGQAVSRVAAAVGQAVSRVAVAAVSLAGD